MNATDLPTEKLLYRGTLRSRGASTFLSRTSAVELLRGVRATEHAWRSIVATERDGYLLDSAQRGIHKHPWGRESIDL